MPISKKDFLDGKFEFARKGSECSNIMDFLKKNKDKAFRPVEIAKEIGGSTNICSRLYLLKKYNKVIHRSPYWMYNNKNER